MHSPAPEKRIYTEQPHPNEWLAVAAAPAAVLAAAGSFGLAGPSLNGVLAVFIMAAGAMLLAVRAAGRRTVVIDRRNGSVVLEDSGALWTRHRSRSLAAYHAVAVWESRSAVDAGYYASRFTVVLLGNDGPLPLLATDDEHEAAAVRRDIEAFLEPAGSRVREGDHA